MNMAGRIRDLRFRGLTAQIALWTVLPLTLVLIGVAFTGVYSHEQAMRELVQERDQALAIVGAAQVRDRLQEQAAALQDLAGIEAFLHRDHAAQQDLLSEVGDLGGQFAAEVALAGLEGQPAPAWLPDPALAEGIQAVERGQEIVLIPLAAVPGGGEGFLLGVPVHDDEGERYGLLAAPLSLTSLDLETVLRQVQVGEHGLVYLVDGQGRILACTPADEARPSLAGHTGLDTALKAGSAGATLCRSPAGERMMLAYAPVEFAGTGWRVLIEEPWNEVVGPVLRYSQFMPLVAALAVVVSLLTLYYGVRAIVRPLQKLGAQAERVAWGDFEATAVPVGGVQEIEDLRRTLDQMTKRIQSYQRGMHDYIAAITQGQEEERKRLARELHDDTAQSLIALSQQVEMAQKTLTADPERATARLASVRAMLADTLEGVRRFSRDLRPIYLEDLGFIPALEILAREAEQREGLAVQFAVAGKSRRLSPDLELVAYRIVQEALNNVVQHAQAARAWVEVRFGDGQLLLSVRDDGVGFVIPDRPEALARRGHFGLMGVQERALLFGGRLSVDSMPDEGTEVVVRLPYPHQD